MSVVLPRAILNISIDLELETARLGSGDRRGMDEVVGRLLTLLAQFDLPATWAVADPAVSSAAGRIRSMGTSHEIALFGDSTWVGREAARSRFARELMCRAVGSRGAGIEISTLALKGAQLELHADLAVKHGITAVRHSGPQADKSVRQFLPRTLRYSLWSFPVSCTLPGRSRWLPGGGSGHRARTVIDKAINERGLVQLAVSAPELAARGSSSLGVLKRVLAHAQSRRRQGLLEIATVAVTARRLSRQQQSKPSHSILHTAA
ncbi:MAG TPA: hypothetical protein VGZ26_07220 [Pirellulales bacterium]|nr:hypothetical protein [Pirellulales bacterium]